jgi:predicted transcriptional regulator
MSPSDEQMSRRERQILQFLFRNGPSTVQDVKDGISAPPGYSAVRAHLATLERKGFARHEVDGPRYVYVPVEPVGRAGRTALRKVLDTFFEGSVRDALATMLEVRKSRLSERELRELKDLIDDARKRGL